MMVLDWSAIYEFVEVYTWKYTGGHSRDGRQTLKSNTLITFVYKPMVYNVYPISSNYWNRPPHKWKLDLQVVLSRTFMVNSSKLLKSSTIILYITEAPDCWKRFGGC